jgi:hypothetical protein
MIFTDRILTQSDSIYGCIFTWRVKIFLRGIEINSIYFAGFQLQPNSAAGSSAIEHDPSCLYLPLADGDYAPGALPLGVSVVDSAVVLFGHVFPHCSPKHKGQLIAHFTDCLKQAKAQRQEAITINVFAGLLLALKVRGSFNSFCVSVKASNFGPRGHFLFQKACY